MKNTISEQIMHELGIVRKTVIDINPSYAPTHTDLLELINLYLNSKYRDSDKDSEGFKKWFINISDFRCKVESKAIDLDTKDVRIVATEGQSNLPAWFFGKDIRMFMKEQMFGKFLNEVKNEAPRWGSVVAKKAGEDISVVNLKNLYPDPETKYLKWGRFINEEHEYTPDELEDVGSKSGWENISKAIDLVKSKGEKETPLIKVFERYGQWEKQLAQSIVVFERIKNTWKEVVLSEEAIKPDEIPYKEFHTDKRIGRWLSKGIVEDLFENQIAENETVNFKRKNMHWGSKYLFESADDTIASSLLSDAVSGQIFKSEKGIKRIDTRESNLPAFRDEESRWDRNADRKTFSHDVMRGESLPSGTPLGSARLQTAQASSYFQGIREDFGIFLKEIFYDWVLPDFKKKNRKEHILNFVGSEPAELEKFDRLVVGYRTNEGLRNFVRKNGKLPMPHQLEMMKVVEKEKIRDNRFMTIPEKHYDNLKYKMDMIITGESIDLSSKLYTLSNALATVATNPMILVNPMTRKMFFRQLDLAGINPAEFETDVDMQGMMDMVTKQSGQIKPVIAPGPVKEEIKI